MLSTQYDLKPQGCKSELSSVPLPELNLLHHCRSLAFTDGEHVTNWCSDLIIAPCGPHRISMSWFLLPLMSWLLNFRPAWSWPQQNLSIVLKSCQSSWARSRHHCNYFRWKKWTPICQTNCAEIKKMALRPTGKSESWPLGGKNFFCSNFSPGAIILNQLGWKREK